MLSMLVKSMPRSSKLSKAPVVTKASIDFCLDHGRECVLKILHGGEGPVGFSLGNDNVSYTSPKVFDGC